MVMITPLITTLLKHTIVAGAGLGWGLLSQFPPFRYFPNFSSLSKHTLTVKYRIYIWLSWAAGTPVKYECDSRNLTCTFARPKILLTEKLKNGALVTPTPGPVFDKRQTSNNHHGDSFNKHQYCSVRMRSAIRYICCFISVNEPWHHSFG